jgi:hypothetical protein
MIQKLVSFAMSRGPARGTWAHQIGGIAAAIVLGVAYFLTRNAA